ncbi:MAG: potassium-transporting ATPase subunit C [Pseudonocardiales bacterium]|nr:potassium-transporting ATPase subunit C [Pseudonocardiales bacterium]
MLTMLLRQAATGLRVLILMTVLCGIVYPLVSLGVAHIPGLADKAEGSIVTAKDGSPAGSSLIGIDPVAKDPAADPYFHTRPSASSKDVLGPADTSTSGGSNKGSFDSDLVDNINKRKAMIAARESADPAQIPPDAVTTSASGIDPDISPAYAALQVARVAKVTGLSTDAVQKLVAESTDGRVLGFLGEPTVNVTTLNLAVAAARS